MMYSSTVTRVVRSLSSNLLLYTSESDVLYHLNQMGKGVKT